MADDDAAILDVIRVESPQWLVWWSHRAGMWYARRVDNVRLTDAEMAAGVRYLLAATDAWRLRAAIAEQAAIEEGIDAAERAAVAKLRADVDAYGADGQDRRGVRDGHR